MIVRTIGSRPIGTRIGRRITAGTPVITAATARLLTAAATITAPLLTGAATTERPIEAAITARCRIAADITAGPFTGAEHSTQRPERLQVVRYRFEPSRTTGEMD